MNCQACNSTDLIHVLSLGPLPPCNDMRPIGEPAKAQEWLPTDLLYCQKCELVQLEYVGDPNVVFPSSYPYTSGSTRLLRENFKDLAQEVRQLIDLKPNDLVVDIGSNDGTLLSNFKGRHRICGIEPTDVADIANERGIHTIKTFFNGKISMDGQAKLITCANCFAHMKDIHDVLEGIVEMLSPDGVFISESTYLIDTLDKLQYDTIYHEHLRYYSLTSLRNLLAQHGLHIFRAKKIPTHGGSIRVYAKRNVSGTAIDRSLTAEPTGNRMRQRFEKFREDVFASKLNLLAKFNEIEKFGLRVWGIGAPSRAATVINYCRLDAMNIPYVLETKGSLKIGKYMPGTDIEVHEELPFDQLQSDYLILFSWHLADELIPKLRAKGYKGKFIMPCEPLDRAENLSQSYHR